MKLINDYKKKKVDFRNTICIIVYMHLNIGQMKVAGKWQCAHRRNNTLRYFKNEIGL